MPQDQQALTPKHAAAILQFLQRAQLTGAEMPAYVEVFNVLSTIAQPDAATETAKDPAPVDATQVDAASS